MPILSGQGGALIASPSDSLRQRVLHQLNGRCRPVQQAAGGAEALAKLEKGGWQVLFLDRRLPDLDTEELIAIIQLRFPRIQVVMVDSDQCQGDLEGGANPEESCHFTAGVAGAPGNQSRLHPASESLPGMIGASEAIADRIDTPGVDPHQVFPGGLFSAEAPFY